ncbi:MAG: hypothetical protein HY675_01015, partial [Chloroflexi bacterium]|nr:hypothetical protein [Chloroflexota bacterium]
MPSVEAHATESLERTGQTYLEVHEWVDNDEETKAARHDITRLVEHSEHVRGIWGEEA